MRATIRQVAERAGVSRTTVSNVMLGRHNIVAPEKRDLVLQAVQEMEYVPIRPILQNRHVKTHVFAVPVDNPRKIGWAINSGTYTGLCETAMKHGFDVMMTMRRDPDWAADRTEVQFLDRRSDGIIFASPVIGETGRTFEALCRHGIPAVVCYRRDVPEGIAWVDPDNESAMFQAVGHLVECGHSKIAHLTERNTEDFDKVERRRHFQRAMRHHGLDRYAEWIVSADYHAPTAQLAHTFMAIGATAVVCMNDLLATDLAKAMQAAGLNLPDDLSIIGMDNVGAADYGLTTIGFSFEDVGQRSVEALVTMIGGQPASNCCHVLPVQLVQRTSVKNLNSSRG